MLCSAARGAWLAARQEAECPARRSAAERHSQARAWVCPGRARTGSDHHHPPAVSGSYSICQAERPVPGAADANLPLSAGRLADDRAPSVGAAPAEARRPVAAERPADAQAPFAEALGDLPARWALRRAAWRPAPVPNCPVLCPFVAVFRSCLARRRLAAAPPGRHSGPAPGRGTRRWLLRSGREPSSMLSRAATPFARDAGNVPPNASEGPTLARMADKYTTCALV